MKWKKLTLKERILIEDKAPQSVSNGVTVKFKPDFERLKMDGISDDIINHIHALLVNIAYAKPHIDFVFQGKQYYCL